jgi:queuine tRNA-ribosyltransferase
MEGFDFTLLATLQEARAGRFKTPHGIVNTPVFMPVGTQAVVKSVTPDDLRVLGSEIILANTYHLYLRPGAELIREMSGLQEFSRWLGPMLTDSGGYQVSSLGLFQEHKQKELLAQVDEGGVTFNSHLDGSIHRFTPETSISIQETLGADIIMAFDECTPNKDKEYAKAAMERTHRWLTVCIQEWKRLEALKQGKSLPQALFGIIQGGRFRELREESAAYVAQKDLPGIALGGESIGGDMEATAETIHWVRPLLPTHLPRYAMGLGTEPNDVIKAILLGVDMFDCVAPTRLARCGLLYSGTLSIRSDSLKQSRFESEFDHCRLTIEKSRFKNDAKQIMTDCDCYTCQSGYSRAYLHHLF